jgi:hypothetical protein
MPETPNSSFIPKQGPAKKTRYASKQVHLFTILSYVLFFGALLASAGVFFYERHIDKTLETEVRNLNSAIASFSDESMEEVRAFNSRLIQAENRLNNSVSLSAMFDSLEESSAQSISLEALSLTRVADDRLLLEADVVTDDFDSALFQRGLYERNPVIENVVYDDLGLGEIAEGEVAPSQVSFTAELEIPLTAIPYEPSDTATPVALPLLTDTSTTTDDIISGETNETDI